MDWRVLPKKPKEILAEVQQALQFVVNLAVLAGVIFAVIQIHDYRLRESAQLVLRFGEYLDDDPYLQISQHLDTCSVTSKVFTPEGPFSVGEIDRYLGTFETLGDLYDNGLITYGMLDNGFSYYIQKAYANYEIKDYIADSRSQNPKLWKGLLSLVDLFVPKTPKP